MPYTAPLLSKLGEVAIKTESTKGSKVTMTLDGTESTVRMLDAALTMDPEQFDRRALSNTLSRFPHLVGQTLAQLTFSYELRKTAATATEDAWGKILRACGCSFNSGTGQYKPTSDVSAHLNLTAYMFRGSTGAANGTVRIGMRGAAGTATLSLETTKPGVFSVTLFGSHDPADSDLLPQVDTLNAVTHELAVPGIFQAAALTWNGFSAKVKSCKIEFGNVVVPRDDASATNGVSEFVVVDREPMFEFDPELTVVGDQDWVGQLTAGTEVAIAFSIAQPAKNGVLARTIAFAAPKAQIKSLSHGDRNGMATIGIVAALNRSSGDDEWTLTITGS